jgi:hypothetical protein
MPTKFHSSVKPEFDSVMTVSKSAVRGISMRCATGKLWNLGDKHLILIAPVDDDLVLMHQSLPPSRFLRITDRTCRTWYGFTLSPSLCTLMSCSTPWLHEAMVAASYTLLKAQAREKLTKILEADVGI